MKALRITVLLLSVGLLSTAYGQNYTLKVLANKGENQVRTANGDWQKLKTGASLVKTDLLKVSKDAYIGFLHYSGAAMEWKKEGTFPVSEIESSISTTSSLVSKYADFLAQKKDEGGKGNIAGGVHRGGNRALFIISPVNAMVMNEQISLTWESEKEDGNYTLVIKNLYSEELERVSVTGNQYQLDFSNSSFGKENMFLISVIETDNPEVESQEVAIIKLDDKKEKNLSKIYKDLSDGIDVNSALGQYIMAGFYEESRLIIDALNSLQKAVQMEPEVELFRDAYQNFLERNQLKKN